MPEGKLVNPTRRSAIGNGIASFAASAGVESLAGQDYGSGDEGKQMFFRLLKSSNESVARMFKDPQAQRGGGVGRGANVAALAAAYCALESAYYKSESRIPLIESASEAYVSAQHADGTIDAGNLA
jgi:hypothetical protein